MTSATRWPCYQAELPTLLAQGIPDDELAVLERPLYLIAAMTGLRQGDRLVELAVRSEYTVEDDLMFAHPLTGEPVDRSK